MAEEKNANNGAARLGLSLKAKKGVHAVPGKKNVSRRWMYVLIAGVLGLIIIITSMSKKEALPPPKVAAAPAINLTPSGLAERSWQAQSQTQIQQQKDKLAAMAAEQSAMQAKVAQIEQQLAAAQNSAPPVSGGSGSSSSEELPPPPPPPPPVPTDSSVSGESDSSGSAPALQAPPLEESGSGESAPSGPYVFSPKPLKGAQAPSDGEGSAAGAGLRKTASKVVAPAGMGVLPTGSFVKVVLLNGVDAGTSSQTRSNPEPVLLRVQDNAVLPGSAHFRLRSCFILGSSYGSLSSERVYIRLAELSCVDRRHKLVLSEPVRGYVVDSDSMLGLRGKVIDRQGAKIGKALLAGFAEGLSNAFGGAQGVMSTSALGSVSTITGSAAVKAAGLSGAATASSQLAQFYLQQASEIFPVLRVGGGRMGTAVFTTNVPLQWGQIQGVTSKSNS